MMMINLAVIIYPRRQNRRLVKSMISLLPLTTLYKYETIAYLAEDVVGGDYTIRAQHPSPEWYEEQQRQELIELLYEIYLDDTGKADVEGCV